MDLDELRQEAARSLVETIQLVIDKAPQQQIKNAAIHHNNIQAKYALSCIAERRRKNISINEVEE